MIAYYLLAENNLKIYSSLETILMKYHWNEVKK